MCFPFYIIHSSRYEVASYCDFDAFPQWLMSWSVFYMIVGLLEECLFNLFAYFKIVLFLLNHRSPLYTVGTKPLCKYFLLFCYQFLAYSFYIHLHAWVLYFRQFYTEDSIYFTHNVFVISPPKITVQYGNSILAHGDSYSFFLLPQSLSLCP